MVATGRIAMPERCNKTETARGFRRHQAAVAYMMPYRGQVDFAAPNLILATEMHHCRAHNLQI